MLLVCAVCCVHRAVCTCVYVLPCNVMSRHVCCVYAVGRRGAAAAAAATAATVPLKRSGSAPSAVAEGRGSAAVAALSSAATVPGAARRRRAVGKSRAVRFAGVDAGGGAGAGAGAGITGANKLHTSPTLLRCSASPTLSLRSSDSLGLRSVADLQAAGEAEARLDELDFVLVRLHVQTWISSAPPVTHACGL